MCQGDILVSVDGRSSSSLELMKGYITGVEDTPVLLTMERGCNLRILVYLVIYDSGWVSLALVVPLPSIITQNSRPLKVHCTSNQHPVEIEGKPPFCGHSPATFSSLELMKGCITGVEDTPVLLTMERGYHQDPPRILCIGLE